MTKEELIQSINNTIKSGKDPKISGDQLGAEIVKVVEHLSDKDAAADEKIAHLETEVFGNKKLDIISRTPFVFNVSQSTLWSRDTMVRVFPESFIRSKPDEIAFVNYRRDAAINRQKRTTIPCEESEHVIKIQSKGYEDESVLLSLYTVNESVFDNRNVRMQIFGTSLHDIDYKDNNGELINGGGSIPDVINRYMTMGKVDLSDNRRYTSIGTRYKSASLEYKGEAYTYLSCHEARSGHNGINYLRQPIHFSPTNVSYDPNVSGTSATGDVMWYMCGLRYQIPHNEIYATSGVDYGEYERTEEKTRMLRNTPFGKFHHDYSAVLWEFCNKKGWITAVGGTYSSWISSDNQKETTDSCMEYIATHPEYPWYDINTARATSYVDGVAKPFTDNSQYAMNLKLYIERYRTMDDEGVRLICADANPSNKTVEGSDGKSYTIGSMITSQLNLSMINVCKPTHVYFEMRYNDWPFYVDQTVDNANGIDNLSNAELFSSIVHSDYGEDTLVGLGDRRRNGSFYPDTWGDIGLAQGYDGFTTKQYSDIIREKYNLKGNIHYVPVFEVSTTLATNFAQECEDVIYGTSTVNSGDNYSETSDITHQGWLCTRAMAHQMYGWLAYTTANSDSLIPQLEDRIIENYGITSISDKQKITTLISSLRNEQLLDKLTYMAFPMYANDVNSAIYDILNNKQTIVSTDSDSNISNNADIWDGINTDTDYLSFQDGNLSINFKTKRCILKVPGVANIFNGKGDYTIIDINNQAASFGNNTYPWYGLKLTNNDIENTLYNGLSGGNFYFQGTTSPSPIIINASGVKVRIATDYRHSQDNSANFVGIYTTYKNSVPEGLEAIDPLVQSSYFSFAPNNGVVSGERRMIAFGKGLSSSEFDKLTTIINAFVS